MAVLICLAGELSGHPAWHLINCGREQPLPPPSTAAILTELPPIAHDSWRSTTDLENAVPSSPTATRLYLELEPGAAASGALQGALSAASIAAVLLRLSPGNRPETATLQSHVRLAQSHNAAAIVERDVGLALQLKADGLHLPWSENLLEQYTDARRQLGPGFIIGVQAGTTRHDAMELAEAGADYIAFGTAGSPPQDQLAQVEWWAEIFEIPCVAIGVDQVSLANALAASGADFIGVPLRTGEPADAGAERVRVIAAALAAEAKSALAAQSRSGR